MMMSCEEIRKKLSAYLDGELEGSEQGVIASHLESCHLCFREYEELQRLNGVLANLDPVEAPPNLWRRVERRLSSPERVGIWQRFARRFAYAPAVAGVLVGLVVGNFFAQAVINGSLQTESNLLTVSNLEDSPPGSFSDIYFYEWEE
jgi:anti-sigma factor (TIGR02949 family)